jgi:signal transduction histidine kinase
MNGPTVKDGLSGAVERVAANAHPRFDDIARRSETVYAVFDDTPELSATSTFLGLVDGRRAALFPLRIFADLLPASPPAPLLADVPLEQAQRRLLDEEAYALPVVDGSGALVGAVTRDSLLAVVQDRAWELARKAGASVDLVEQQRSLIAFEIHDGLVQYATAAQMHLQSVATAQEAGEPWAAEQFARGMALLEEVIREARSLIRGLHPPGLDEGGVIAAIENLVDQQRSAAGVDIEFDYALEGVHLSKAQEIAIFRIVQEALANASRHSGSDRIQIELIRNEAHVHLTIRDWGRGFVPGPVLAGHGLTSIRYRAHKLHGQARIESSPEEGTTIVVDFPVEQPDS